MSMVEWGSKPQPSLLGPDGLPLSRRPPNYKVDPLRSGSDPVHESTVDFNGGFHIVTEQNCDDTISAVQDAGSLIPRKTKADGARYAGSVPVVQALVWSKECGAAVGTREWSEYAATKMKDGDFKKFKVGS